MRYVHDEVADQSVLRHETLHDVVHGRAVMLWLPGTTTGLAVQGALLLGAAGPNIALLFMYYRDATQLPFFVGSLFVLALITSVLLRGVVRGAPSGRTRVYRLSLCQLGVSVCVALISIARWHTASLIVSVGGALMSFIASRLVAGPDQGNRI